VRYSSCIPILVVLLGTAVLCGCSKEDNESDSHDRLWIWNYASQPSADNDAALAFLDFVTFAKDECPEDQWQKAIELLRRIAMAKESSVQVLVLSQPVTDDNLFQWTFSGREVESPAIKMTGECITRVVDKCNSECDAESMEALAEILLLVGYQLSRNGEDPAMAVLRMTLWRMAIDLLLAAQEEPDAELLEIRECLRLALRKMPDWENAELRPAGWEACGRSSGRAVQ